MATTAVKLETSDGVVFNVEPRVVKCFGVIKNMLEDGLISDETEDDAIPLPNVSEKVLRKVLDWAMHHVDDPEKPKYLFDDDDGAPGKRNDEIDAWDIAFMQMDQQMLGDVMVAANYLDVAGLARLCCKTVANMMKGKTSEEIRRIFAIENDFAPCEETMIHQRNRHCTENK